MIYLLSKLMETGSDANKTLEAVQVAILDHVKIEPT